MSEAIRDAAKMAILPTPRQLRTCEWHGRVVSGFGTPCGIPTYFSRGSAMRSKIYYHPQKHFLKSIDFPAAQAALSIKTGRPSQIVFATVLTRDDVTCSRTSSSASSRRCVRTKGRRQGCHSRQGRLLSP